MFEVISFVIGAVIAILAPLFGVNVPTLTLAPLGAIVSFFLLKKMGRTGFPFFEISSGLLVGSGLMSYFYYQEILKNSLLSQGILNLLVWIFSFVILGMIWSLILLIKDWVSPTQQD